MHNSFKLHYEPINSFIMLSKVICNISVVCLYITGGFLTTNNEDESKTYYEQKKNNVILFFNFLPHQDCFMQARYLL